jgi:uncharacterized heparinase superfamily protein
VQILGPEAIGDHRYLLSTGAVLFGRPDFKRAAGRFWEESFWLLGPDAPGRFAAQREPADPPVSKAYFDGGFFVLRRADTHVFIDCGNVGMRGIGGHGHNDILAFELVLEGVRIVTDCGAYLYTASREWRNAFRSTAFHNTVQVDGEELNRFIGPDALWQLRYDAVPVGPALVEGASADECRGGHRGYERLPSPVAHTRECIVYHDVPRVIVRDVLDGEGEHTLVWRFHLDPEVVATVEGAGIRLSSRGRDAWLQADLAASFALSLEPGWISPSYGVKVPTTVVVWRGSTALPLSASFSFSDTRQV